MPEAMENQRIVSNMGLEYDDDALVDFSKAFITSKQTELEIKYPNLQPIWLCTTRIQLRVTAAIWTFFCPRPQQKERLDR